ncbi:hypothetical protein J4442_00450 [Candidatus Woesearchaeota archaeon]|nr:hypothetical protein [Candidatus Woesearchaeota archaeon]
MTECYECKNGKLEKKKINYEIYGVNVGRFEAEVCDKCGETYFSEETSDRISEETKKLGLWGLESRTKIGVVGTTLDLRFNKKLIEFLKLRKGKEAVIYPESREKFIVELK